MASPRMGERSLTLLDDMSNWGLRKLLLAEVDVFQIDHTHELYAHMNINYVRAAALPDVSTATASCWTRCERGTSSSRPARS